VSSRGPGSIPVAIARLGFDDAARAFSLLQDPALAGLIHSREHIEDHGLAAALAAVPDADGALLGLVRFMEVVGRDPELRGPVTEALAAPGPARQRLLVVLGSSAALGDHLCAHPHQWSAVTRAQPLTAQQRIQRLVEAVSAPEGAPAVDVLRTAYREQLLEIAALDLTSGDPLVSLPETAAALADLAQAALEAALVIARDEVGADAGRTRLAVIAMGKTGGRELNYISDVDVIFVAEPADGVPEDEPTAAATDLATRLMRICSASTAAGALWQVDPALRPEGKNGPLVRTVVSHRSYYERWAKTWEFQALLKARPVAG
jgi:glutamate-ammonia-ligase adenylyltransferase